MDHRPTALTLGLLLTTLPLAAATAYLDTPDDLEAAVPGHSLPPSGSQAALAAELLRIAATADHGALDRDVAFEVTRLAVHDRLAMVGGALPQEVAPRLHQQLRNVHTAERLLDAATVRPTLTLSDAVPLVALASAWQAASVGVVVGGVEAPSAGAGVVDRLAALAAMWESELPPATATRLDAWAVAHPAVGEALAVLVDAHIAFAGASTEAIEAGPLQAGLPVGVATSPLMGKALAARLHVLRAAVALDLAVQADPPVPTGGDCAPIVVAPAFALDLDGCATTHLEDVALLVDVGGADRYRNNAGGSHLVATVCNPLCWAGAAVAVDLDGDDDYQGGDLGYNGGANVGAGFLLDVRGDDTYVAGGTSVNGGGHLAGSGFLLDVEGSDQYIAERRAVNGGGVLAGHGLLMDLGGDDSYTAHIDGVNGGATQMGAGFLLDARGSDRYVGAGRGVNGGAVCFCGIGEFVVGNLGFLVDVEGDDVYTETSAQGFPHNGGSQGGAASGAVGFLLDGAGDDRYLGSWSAQGGASHDYAVGMLMDLRGNDLYVGADGSVVRYLGYGVNGGGEEAVGFLVDGGGHDTYVASSGGTNGGGYHGVGFLFDAAGDDRYNDLTGADPLPGVVLPAVAEWGVNGGAACGGTGLLVDGAGDDRYRATRFGVNGGGAEECVYSNNIIAIPTVPMGIGALVDACGTDVYQDDEGASGTDRTVVPKGTAGAQVDGPGRCGR